MGNVQDSEFEVAKARDGFFRVSPDDRSKYEVDLGDAVLLGNFQHEGFLVPSDRLAEFRLSDEEARQVKEAAGAEEADEVEGFDMSLTNPFGLNFATWTQTSRMGDHSTCC